MESIGSNFERGLAGLYRAADPANQFRLHVVFESTFEKFYHIQYQHGKVIQTEEERIKVVNYQLRAVVGGKIECDCFTKNMNW